MGKRPAFQFYTGDWLKDEQLRKCGLAAKGFWMDMLCFIDQSGKGSVTGTLKELARMAGCDSSEAEAAIAELQRTETATVTERNGEITLTNRRMEREAKEKSANALRQKRHREKAKSQPKSQQSNAPSSSSTSSSTSVIPDGVTNSLVESLRFEWPKNKATSIGRINSAAAEILHSVPDPQAISEQILRNAKAYLSGQSEARYVRQLHNWLADGDWQADYSPQDGEGGWIGKTVRVKASGEIGRVNGTIGDDLTLALESGEPARVKPEDVEVV